MMSSSTSCGSRTKRCIGRQVCVLLLLAFASCIASAQKEEPASSTQSPTCGFTELYRASGWDIPGVEHGVPDPPRMDFAPIPGVGVINIQPRPLETAILFAACIDAAPGRLTLEEMPVRVLHLMRFDVKGKVFAYGVSLGGQSDHHGKRADVGSAYSVFYYDSEGKGIFTVMRFEKNWFNPQFVPDWVKNELSQLPKVGDSK